MSRYLLDTNIISEFRKKDRCNLGVKEWISEVDSSALYLSVLVVGEIRQGIESIRRRDSLAAGRLTRWLNNVRSSFADRILPITSEIADEWGRLNSRRSYPVVDGLMIATAKTGQLVLVTRNEKDVSDGGIDYLNPFR